MDKAPAFYTEDPSGMQRLEPSAGDSGLRVVVEGHPDGDPDEEDDEDGDRREKPAERRAPAPAARPPLERAHEA
jgi:hypothetical protein